MLIYNKNLTKEEKKWLEFMLSEDFLYKQNIVEQINCAIIERNFTDFYLSINFKYELNIKPIKIRERVPIEMRIYGEDRAPIQFLLHVISGLVSELEIFYADSSKISNKIQIEDAKKEIIIASDLKY